ncbi:hypothetical protein HYH03_007380 [Edaphochlamys debaryana]|uniref:HTH myb-type domain-containing protein n=1 Tax=Edaphochlamys debaryana TaxID=47281 RepID=A0A836BZU5_9CHLO|nr:hypothetical protein HYH03_007380 [Edaphochlamys debaryana]|eukprot:KAG2494322.1 hypothetical protein HYH03_007380 [Edaphochlamys debaryana]
MEHFPADAFSQRLGLLPVVKAESIDDGLGVGPALAATLPGAFVLNGSWAAALGWVAAADITVGWSRGAEGATEDGPGLDRPRPAGVPAAAAAAISASAGRMTPPPPPEEPATARMGGRRSFVGLPLEERVGLLLGARRTAAGSCGRGGEPSPDGSVSAGAGPDHILSRRGSDVGNGECKQRLSSSNGYTGCPTKLRGSSASVDTTLTPPAPWQSPMRPPGPSARVHLAQPHAAIGQVPDGQLPLNPRLAAPALGELINRRPSAPSLSPLRSQRVQQGLATPARASPGGGSSRQRAAVPEAPQRRRSSCTGSVRLGATPACASTPAADPLPMTPAPPLSSTQHSRHQGVQQPQSTAAYDLLSPSVQLLLSQIRQLRAPRQAVPGAGAGSQPEHNSRRLSEPLSREAQQCLAVPVVYSTGDAAGAQPLYLSNRSGVGGGSSKGAAGRDSLAGQGAMQSRQGSPGAVMTAVAATAAATGGDGGASSSAGGNGQQPPLTGGQAGAAHWGRIVGPSGNPGPGAAVQAAVGARPPPPQEQPTSPRRSAAGSVPNALPAVNLLLPAKRHCMHIPVEAAALILPYGAGTMDQPIYPLWLRLLLDPGGGRPPVPYTSAFLQPSTDVCGITHWFFGLGPALRQLGIAPLGAEGPPAMVRLVGLPDGTLVMSAAGDPAVAGAATAADHAGPEEGVELGARRQADRLVGVGGVMEAGSAGSHASADVAAPATAAPGGDSQRDRNSESVTEWRGGAGGSGDVDVEVQPAGARPAGVFKHGPYAAGNGGPRQAARRRRGSNRPALAGRAVRDATPAITVAAKAAPPSPPPAGDVGRGGEAAADGGGEDEAPWLELSASDLTQCRVFIPCAVSRLLLRPGDSPPRWGQLLVDLSQGMRAVFQALAQAACPLVPGSWFQLRPLRPGWASEPVPEMELVVWRPEGEGLQRGDRGGGKGDGRELGEDDPLTDEDAGTEAEEEAARSGKRRRLQADPQGCHRPSLPGAGAPERASAMQARSGSPGTGGCDGKDMYDGSCILISDDEEHEDQQLPGPRQELHALTASGPAASASRARALLPTTPGILWTPALHSRFLQAVNTLGGVERATAGQILPLMRVEGLTVQNVDAHLYGHRQRLRTLREGAANPQKAEFYDSGRIRWTAPLHARFMQAVTTLGGLQWASPSSILLLMQVKGLTRVHVQNRLNGCREKARRQKGS